MLRMREGVVVYCSLPFLFTFWRQQLLILHNNSFKNSKKKKHQIWCFILNHHGIFIQSICQQQYANDRDNHAKASEVGLLCIFLISLEGRETSNNVMGLLFIECWWLIVMVNISLYCFTLKKSDLNMGWPNVWDVSILCSFKGAIHHLRRCFEG